MLLGRGRECGAIDAVLDAARRGRPHALLLRGPPGIGLSALLEWAAAAPAMRKVAVRGSELEARSRWSSIRQVVAALGEALDALPADQIHALTSGIDPGAATRDEHVGAALAALLSTAGSQQPLLVLVDDAQWLDRESRDALTLAVKRLARAPVALLVALHVDADEPWEDLPEITVGGLSPIDAVTLLRGRVDPRVAEQLGTLAEGNPLAMLEVAAHLTPEQRSGDAALGPVVPLGWTLSRHLIRHADDLAHDQRCVLVLVAAAPGIEVTACHAAATAAGWDPDVVDTLVQPGLLRRDADDRLHFERALMSDAIYQSVRPETRRAAHLALAAVLTEQANAEARAWHLAAEATKPDATAERALQALASDLMSRDARSAGNALARAAELAGTPKAAAQHLLAAGRAYSFADMNGRALELLDRALTLTDDPADQAELHLARAGPRLASSRSPRAFQDLARMADRIEPEDADQASSLNALAALTALAAGDLDRSRELCRRALDLASGPGRRTTRMAEALWGLLLMLAGECHEATRLLSECDAPDDEAWQSDATLIYEDLVAHALAWVGEVSAASRLVTAMVEQSRQAGAGVILARSLVVRADLYLRAGYWNPALTDAQESLALASKHDAPGSITLALAVMTRLEAGLGHSTDARRHGLESLAVSEESELAVNGFWARGALGFLALSEGNGHEAIEHLEAARAFAEKEGLELIVGVPWAPDLVEAYVRVGRVADGRRLVSELEARGVGGQCALADALLSRCAGLVGNGNADGSYRRALAAHTEVLAPFERARSLLSYGEWLRRERRLPDAIPHLEEAAAIFSDLGAKPWHDRTTSELVAHGRRGATAPRRGMRALTPQEIRVARTVAGGATNRETAAALFLSTRTVEYHLSNVYRKLGVRSRSELTRRLGEDPDFTLGTPVSDDA